MTKVFVKDLKDKQAFQTVFMAMGKNLLTDKNGKPYMSLNLVDITGSVNARMWEKVDSADRLFESGDFILVKGHLQYFQNRPQVVIHDISLPAEGSFQLSDYIESTQVPPEELFQQLVEIVENKIKDKNIQRLILESLNDPKCKPLILKSPAAKSIHHAYLGGLLEHVLSISEIMIFLAEHYKFLDLDLLLFGAIFHDLGKIWELEIDHGIRYTDEGRLLGHMSLACELIDEKCAGILGFPKETKELLKHIVLSHHGKLEYGSPKRPMFLEAFIVAMIDDLDSKVHTMHRFMKEEIEASGDDSDWSRYHPGFDRYFYLGVLKKKLSAIK